MYCSGADLGGSCKYSSVISNIKSWVVKKEEP